MKAKVRSSWAVFFDGNFFLLWLGQVLAQFGDKLTQLALVGLIYQYAVLSAATMSHLVFFMVLPVFLLGPLAGVLADRWDRKRTLVISDFLRALLIAGIPLALKTFPSSDPHFFYPVYALVFAVFAVGRFFIPAKIAIIPEIIPEEDLRVANAISSTSKMIATVLGLLLGGIIVAKWGAMLCFWLNSLGFLLSGLCLLFLKRRILLNQDMPKGSFLSEIKNVCHLFMEGLKELKQSQDLIFVVKLLSILMFAGGFVFVFFPVFVKEQYDLTTNGLSLLIGSLGAGLFLGAMGLGHFFRKMRNKTLFIASLAWVSTLFLLFLTIPYFTAACLLMFAIGLGAAPIVICTETLIQHLVQDESIGRVYSVVEVLIHAVFLFALLLASYVGDVLSSKRALLVMALFFISSFAFIFWKDRRMGMMNS